MRCFRHLLGHLESHLYSKVQVILRLSQCTALTYIKYRYKRKFIYLQAIRKGFRTTIYPVKHTIISKTRHLPVTYTNLRLSTSIDLCIRSAMADSNVHGKSNIQNSLEMQASISRCENNIFNQG